MAGLSGLFWLVGVRIKWLLGMKKHSFDEIYCACLRSNHI